MDNQVINSPLQWRILFTHWQYQIQNAYLAHHLPAKLLALHHPDLLNQQVQLPPLLKLIQSILVLIAPWKAAVFTMELSLLLNSFYLLILFIPSSVNNLWVQNFSKNRYFNKNYFFIFWSALNNENLSLKFFI